MSWIKSGGLMAGLLAIITLVIALLKSVIGLIGFVSFALKVGLVAGFVALFLIIGLLALRTFQARRRERNDV